jgi:hypothetical protein
MVGPTREYPPISRTAHSFIDSPSWVNLLRHAQLDRHDIIETEANSSATASLALFSGCNISKSSIAGSAFCRSCGRTTAKSGLYIRPRKPFVINQYLYIQNRNPCVISKSMGYTPGVVFRPSATPSANLPVCIYVPGSPLPSTNICIYRTASHLLSTNRWYIPRGRVHGARPAQNSAPNPGLTISPKQSCNPLQAAPECPAVSSLPSRRKYLCHASHA